MCDMVIEPAEQFADAFRDQWGRNVRERRLEAGWTQEQLSEKAEVSQGTIAKIEAGKAWPSDVVKVRIAWALGSKPGALWGWERV